MYQIRTSEYVGPLDKLLELIESKKLDITTVSIAEVTQNFIDYTKIIQETEAPEIVSNFIVIAARLILIKSKVLLPSLNLTVEEETEIHDLEARLSLYRDFKKVGVVISGIFSGTNHAFARTFLQNAPSIFNPPNTTIEALLSSIAEVFKDIYEFLPKEERQVERRVVSIEEKINELINRLTAAKSYSFLSLAENSPKTEIIALFLAVLHLLKNQKIQVVQKNYFDDIIITK